MDHTHTCCLFDRLHMEIIEFTCGATPSKRLGCIRYQSTAGAFCSYVFDRGECMCL